MSRIATTPVLGRQDESRQKIQGKGQFIGGRAGWPRSLRRSAVRRWVVSGRKGSRILPWEVKKLAISVRAPEGDALLGWALREARSLGVFSQLRNYHIPRFQGHTVKNNPKLAKKQYSKAIAELSTPLLNATEK